MTTASPFPSVVDAAAEEHSQRFAGERILVVPRSDVHTLLTGDLSGGVAITDCGFFPQAAGHFRARVRAIDECIVIACVSGSGWYDIGDGRQPVTAGQVLLVPPGQIHAYGADAQSPWTIWWAHLAGAGLGGFLRAHGMHVGATLRTPSSFFETSSLLSQIVRLLEQDMTERSQIRAAGTAWHLLSVLAADRSLAVGMDQLVDEAAAVIRADLSEKASAERFARSAHVSKSHFGAQFRERFGVSVSGYQLQARMARARELFDLGGRSVSEVAASAGYDDPLYFTRQFTKFHGVSPSAYRRGERGGV